MKSWQNLEIEIRNLAQVKWAMTCNPETLAGQKIDGVIRLRPDYIVALEVTENATLEKVRSDCNKLSIVKQAKFAENIYVESYLVVDGHVTESMRATAESLRIELSDVAEFSSRILGGEKYLRERRLKPFGSAVVPKSGVSDSTAYVAISYIDAGGKAYSVSDIVKELINGRAVVLLGEFGTGKSRCLMECYNQIEADKQATFNPLAINLRDCWGLEHTSEIVGRHLGELGLREFSDPIIRSINRGNHILFLDGFDELASQSWDGDMEALSINRKNSLMGVRSLLAGRGGSGVLVTGREHYFESNSEMLDCLGLDSGTLVLKCPEEFTLAEARQYLEMFESVGTEVLGWIPRKPLICQLYVDLGEDKLREIEAKSEGQVTFFKHSLDAICEREARISDSLNANSVKSILLKIAEDSRAGNSEIERITQDDLQSAYTSVVGGSPVHSSATLLQRLPYLGRIDSGTNDRVFIDDYAKNGLRGLSVASWIERYDGSVPAGKWNVPLSEFGLRVVAEHCPHDSLVVKFANNCFRSTPPNDQAAADVVAARLLAGPDVFDFQGLQIDGAHVSFLDFTEKSVKGLYFNATFVDNLLLESADLRDVVLMDCHVERLEGLAGDLDLSKLYPDWNVDVQFIEQSFTPSRLSEMDLSDSQKILLSMLQKLFRQSGGGRKQSALLRGVQKFWEPSEAKRILKDLRREGMVDRFRNRQGEYVYVPNRKCTTRVNDIFRNLKQSSDSLWPASG